MDTSQSSGAALEDRLRNLILTNSGGTDNRPSPGPGFAAPVHPPPHDAVPAQAAAVQAELQDLWDRSLAAIKEWEKSVPEFACK